MSSLTEAAATRMRIAGWTVKLEMYVVPLWGATRTAQEKAAQLKAMGFETLIEDDLERDGMTGFRLWARRP